MDEKQACSITAYYDGSCPLCRAEIAHYRKQTDSDDVAFVDVTDPNSSFPDGLDRDTALARFHVSRDDGSLVSGARAFSEIWSRARGWTWLARISHMPGILQILEVLYRLFLPIRPMLSKVFARLFVERGDVK